VKKLLTLDCIINSLPNRYSQLIDTNASICYLVPFCKLFYEVDNVLLNVETSLYFIICGKKDILGWKLEITLVAFV
jgi:hypothetical protein